MDNEIKRQNADLLDGAGGLAGEIELEKSPDDMYMDAMID